MLNVSSIIHFFLKWLNIKKSIIYHKIFIYKPNFYPLSLNFLSKIFNNYKINKYIILIQYYKLNMIITSFYYEKDIICLKDILN